MIPYLLWGLCALMTGICLYRWGRMDWDYYYRRYLVRMDQARRPIQPNEPIIFLDFEGFTYSTAPPRLYLRGRAYGHPIIPSGSSLRTEDILAAPIPGFVRGSKHLYRIVKGLRHD